MTEAKAEKEVRYDEVMRRIRALLDGESDWIAAMATVACELHLQFAHYDWTGFYRAVGDELIIGPYQGTHGCLRIKFGRGVCGTVAETRKTEIVPDVDAFPGHIACSSASRSEIVVPVVSAQTNKLMAVLDVDSNNYDQFDDVDKRYLEELCALLGKQFGEE